MYLRAAARVWALGFEGPAAWGCEVAPQGKPGILLKRTPAGESINQFKLLHAKFRNLLFATVVLTALYTLINIIPSSGIEMYID